MGKQMKNAPVYFTVAQVRFNPVLGLESYLPPIQEKMRKEGFPDFKSQTIKIQQFTLSPKKEDASPVVPSVVSQQRYIFRDIKNISGFIIENNSIALQTTAYQTFKSFLDSFQSGISIVNEALRLDFIERIGLRYLDAVLPRSNESLTDYLRSEVMGLSQNHSSTHLLHSFSETVVAVGIGKLISRVIIKEGQLGLPAELVALAPKIDERFLVSKERHAILDTDAFCESRETFSADKIGSTLGVLHEEINKVFDSIITPHALATWE